MKFMLIAFLLVLVMPAVAENDCESLRTLLDEFLAGASVNDAAMHDRFWAEDLVYTSSAGKRFGKAEIMAGLAASHESDEQPADAPSYSAQAVNIRTFDDMAVITFRLVAAQQDQPTSEYFNTGVFHRREGQWQAVAWQATQVGDQPE